MKTKYADEHGHLAPKYSFISGVLSGVPSALVVVTHDSSRHPSTTQDSRSLWRKRKEWAQSVWPRKSTKSTESPNCTVASTQLPSEIPWDWAAISGPMTS